MCAASAQTCRKRLETHPFPAARRDGLRRAVVRFDAVLAEETAKALNLVA